MKKLFRVTESCQRIAEETLGKEIYFPSPYWLEFDFLGGDCFSLLSYIDRNRLL
jgi:hypothetical protein